MTQELDWTDVEPGRVAHYQLIVDALRTAPDGLTRRELERPTGLRPNQITGRVAELRERRWIRIAGVRTCSVSGEADVEILMLPPWLAKGGKQQRLEAWG